MKTKLTLVSQGKTQKPVFVMLPVDKDGNVRMTETQFRAAGFTPVRYIRKGSDMVYDGVMSGGTLLIIENPKN